MRKKGCVVVCVKWMFGKCEPIGYYISLNYPSAPLNMNVGSFIFKHKDLKTFVLKHECFIRVMKYAFTKMNDSV